MSYILFNVDNKILNLPSEVRNWPEGSKIKVFMIFPSLNQVRLVVELVSTHSYVKRRRVNETYWIKEEDGTSRTVRKRRVFKLFTVWCLTSERLRITTYFNKGSTAIFKTL